MNIPVDLLHEIALIELSRMQRENKFQEFLNYLDSKKGQKEAKNVYL